jgi:hypothetical protein
MVVDDHIRHHRSMFQILQRAAMVVAALEVSLSLRCLLSPRVRGGAR